MKVISWVLSGWVARTPYKGTIRSLRGLHGVGHQEAGRSVEEVFPTSVAQLAPLREILQKVMEWILSGHHCSQKSNPAALQHMRASPSVGNKL